MANSKNTSTLILIFALLFVAQCYKASSARNPASSPNPTSKEEGGEKASPEEEASSDKKASPEEEASSDNKASPEMEASSPEKASTEEETSSSDKKASPEEEASSPEKASTEEEASSDKKASEEEASSPEKASPEEEASSSSDEDEEDDEGDSSSSAKVSTSSTDKTSSSEEDTASPTPTSGPTSDTTDTADSPMSFRELFEIPLPDIGIQKAAVAPKTEGAKVANKQLEGIEHRIDEFKAILTKRQANPQTTESEKKCLTQCEGNLEDAIDGVKISIESINNQDLRKANIDISGIATDIETCNDCFIELEGEDKEINGFNEWVKGVTKECLINLEKT